MPIIQCNCPHPGQDAIHGRGNRVANPVKNAARELETLRCTVCKREITRSRKTPLVEDEKGKKGKADKAEAKVDTEPTKPAKAVNPVPEKKGKKK